MSREAMAIPAGLLIFKDIQFRGFWMARWKEQVMNATNGNAGRLSYDAMLTDVVQLIANGRLTAAPHDAIRMDFSSLDQALDAIRRSQAAFTNSKQIFLFDLE
jgi:trans-2-enoyl-CoA reductase